MFYPIHLWCLFSGVQAPDDLRCSGGSGDLVHQRPDLCDPPGRSQPERLHGLEELWLGQKEKARQRTSHQVRPGLRFKVKVNCTVNLSVCVYREIEIPFPTIPNTNIYIKICMQICLYLYTIKDTCIQTLDNNQRPLWLESFYEKMHTLLQAQGQKST